MFNTQVLSVQFVEFPFTHYSISEAHPFDITLSELSRFASGKNFTTVSADQYCQCLLTKVFTIQTAQCRPFIQHQCGKTINPNAWLNSLDDLININHTLFTTLQLQIRVEKLIMFIEFVRFDIENNKIKPANKFDFERVKAMLKTLTGPGEQKKYLLELRAEYLQNKPKIIDSTEVPFDQKIMIEIEKIDHLQNINHAVSPKQMQEHYTLSQKYIDNQEFIIMMKISKRTAGYWRENGIIPFIQIGARIFYKITDVENLLNSRYINPLNKKK